MRDGVAPLDSASVSAHHFGSSLPGHLGVVAFAIEVVEPHWGRTSHIPGGDQGAHWVPYRKAPVRGESSSPDNVGDQALT
eukprot:12663522-Heterocapsa_arctica.AAC.1